MDGSYLIQVAGQLFLAVFLGALVAYKRSVDSYRLNIIQAHAFLSAAAAMFMLVIQNNIVSAVGLLGAASVIRYRYAMRSSKDASTLIIALGIGMACGLTFYKLACLAAAFTVLVGYWFSSLHIVLPRFIMRHRETVELHIETTDYRRSYERLQAIASELGLQIGVRSLQRKLTAKRGPTVDAIFYVTYDPTVNLGILSEQLLDEYTFRVSWKERGGTTN